MSVNLKLVTRVALFCALVYVLSWTTVYLFNVSLIFFIVFSAGFLWGAPAGMIVGFVGMGLWSVFNPFGPAHPYVLAAQMLGASLSGIVGAVFQRSQWFSLGRMMLSVWLIIAAIMCTALYYLPVNLVDAYLIGPFWPRFVTSALWSLISMVSNMFIFPLLFGVTRYLYRRESELLWRSP